MPEKEFKYKGRVKEYMAEYSRKWAARNVEKRRAYSKKYAANNREKVTARHRRYMWKRKYGISPADFAELARVQNGLCLICSGLPTKNGFHVDHDHKTGIVRGLLCSNCNSLLGLAKEDRETLRAAIRYLEMYAA